MLLTILGILKIIGIILASIIGLVTVLLFLVLLVPFRYLVKAEKNGGVRAIGKISWLLHFVTVSASYRDGETDIRLRILGIPVKLEKKKDASRGAEPGGTPEKESGIGKDENTALSTEQGMSRGSGNAETGTSVPDEQMEAEKSVWQIFKKASTILNRIVLGVRNIKFTIRRFCDKIKYAENLMGNIMDFLRDERNWEAFRIIKDQIKVLLRHIRPSRFRINLKYGMGDPADTGQILGGIGILYPLIYQCVVVEPDFENKILEGDALVKGRIRVLTLLIIALKLYFNENVKYLIQRFKSIRRKQNGSR